MLHSSDGGKIPTGTHYQHQAGPDPSQMEDALISSSDNAALPVSIRTFDLQALQMLDIRLLVYLVKNAQHQISDVDAKTSVRALCIFLTLRIWLHQRPDPGHSYATCRWAFFCIGYCGYWIRSVTSGWRLPAGRLGHQAQAKRVCQFERIWWGSSPAGKSENLCELNLQERWVNTFSLSDHLIQPLQFHFCRFQRHLRFVDLGQFVLNYSKTCRLDFGVTVLQAQTKDTTQNMVASNIMQNASLLVFDWYNCPAVLSIEHDDVTTSSSGKGVETEATTCMSDIWITTCYLHPAPRQEDTGHDGDRWVNDSSVLIFSPAQPLYKPHKLHRNFSTTRSQTEAVLYFLEPVSKAKFENTSTYTYHFSSLSCSSSSFSFVPSNSIQITNGFCERRRMRTTSSREQRGRKKFSSLLIQCQRAQC